MYTFRPKSIHIRRWTVITILGFRQTPQGSVTEFVHESAFYTTRFVSGVNQDRQKTTKLG